MVYSKKTELSLFISFGKRSELLDRMLRAVTISRSLEQDEDQNHVSYMHCILLQCNSLLNVMPLVYD